MSRDRPRRWTAPFRWLKAGLLLLARGILALVTGVGLLLRWLGRGLAFLGRGDARRRQVGAAVAVLVLLTAAQWSVAAVKRSGLDAAPVPAGAVRAWVGPVTSLHPADVSSGNPGSRSVLRALFTGLVDTDPTTGAARWGPDVPDAVALDVSSGDGRIWTITLKPGWAFHDGTPVTAGAVVASWNAAAYGPSRRASASLLSNVAGYEQVRCPGDDCTAGLPPTAALGGLTVVNDLQFQVTLSGPFGQYPDTLAHEVFLPLPDAARADPLAFGQAPIGNGPMRIAAGTAGSPELRLARFDAYAGTPAALDELELVLRGGPGDGYAGLATGRWDVAVGLPPATVPKAQRELSGLVLAAGTEIVYLGLPLYDPRFASADLRRALSLAIDRQALAQDLVGGGAIPADGLLPPVVRGPPGAPCGVCTVDAARARMLLQAAGGFEGTMRLWFPDSPGSQALVEAVATQWAANLGLRDFELASLDFAELVALLRRAEVNGPFLGAWSAVTATPSAVLPPLFGLRGAANDTRYRDETTTELLSQATGALAPLTARQIFAQAEDRILADVPVIPLWFSTVPVGHSPRVTGVEVDALGRWMPARLRLAS